LLHKTKCIILVIEAECGLGKWFCAVSRDIFNEQSITKSKSEALLGE
jgi:hypothetical protein